MTREYLEVDIPLNLKEKGFGTTGSLLKALDTVRMEANSIIRRTVDYYRAQGWTPEGGIDLLTAYRARRVRYKQAMVWSRKYTFIDMHVTFHRDSK